MSEPSEGCSEPIEVDESEIFLEAVGGLKKQRIYGLGSESSSLYSRFSWSASSSSRAQQEALEQEVRQLRETVASQQVQLQQQETQLQEKMEEKMRLMQEEQIRLMQEEMRKMRAEFSNSSQARD